MQRRTFISKKKHCYATKKHITMMTVLKPHMDLKQESIVTSERKRFSGMRNDVDY